MVREEAPDPVGGIGWPAVLLSPFACRNVGCAARPARAALTRARAAAAVAGDPPVDASTHQIGGYHAVAGAVDEEHRYRTRRRAGSQVESARDRRHRREAPSELAAEQTRHEAAVRES